MLLQSLMDFLGYSASLWIPAAQALSQFPNIVASVIYTDGQELDALETSPRPLLQHVHGKTQQPLPPLGKNGNRAYHYPTARDHWFSAGEKDFDYSSDSVAHTRNLQFLKPKMGGPYFDLETIWEEHTYYEFADRSVEHTMSTMVQEPYVNHVPTVSERSSDCHRTMLTNLTANGRCWKKQTDRLLPQQLHFQQLSGHGH